MNKNPSIVFFGTSDFSVRVLSALKEKGILPSLVVTAPDKPVGRKQTVTPPPAKVWAQEHKISFLQPETLKGDFAEKLKGSGGASGWDLFIVASYGKIIPSSVLSLPRHHTLNVHPSLLPKFRGASPIETAIIEGEETGVTIMEVDEQMDHGPVVSQKKLVMEWPQDYQIASDALARLGGELLARIIPDWISGTVKGTAQNHDEATFTKKILTEDGMVDLSENALKNWKKFLAYAKSPGIYFFAERNRKKIRIRITKAEFANEEFVIHRVTPEGKKEMEYSDFKRGEKKGKV